MRARSLVARPAAALATTMAAALVTALGCLPAPAIASLPLFPNQLVQPAKSIGGLRLGVSAEFASQRWTGAGGCGPYDETCSFSAGPKGTAYYRLFAGHVEEIGVVAGLDEDGDPILRGPLKRIRTQKGIGIGSRVPGIEKAYPKGSFEGESFFLRGRRGRFTLFLLDGIVVRGVVVSR